MKKPTQLMLFLTAAFSEEDTLTIAGMRHLLSAEPTCEDKLSFIESCRGRGLTCNKDADLLRGEILAAKALCKTGKN